MDTKNPSFPDPEEYYAFMDAPGPSPDPKFADAAMESPRSNLAGAWARVCSGDADLCLYAVRIERGG
jgi:hypothetical protein